MMVMLIVRHHHFHRPTRFSWHRHACGSNDGPEHYTFNSSCVSPGDNSAQRMLTVDEEWIVRPPPQSCPNRWVSTAAAVPVVVTPHGSSSSSSMKVSTTEAVLAVVCLLLLAVAITQFWYGRYGVKQAALKATTPATSAATAAKARSSSGDDNCSRSRSRTSEGDDLIVPLCAGEGEDEELEGKERV